MKRVIFLFILIASCSVSMAQSGKLSGTVLDSLTQTPLELATVTLQTKDSTLIGYKLSDKDGNFLFEHLPLKEQIRFTVSYVGYKTFQSLMELENPDGDTLRILLPLNIDDSNAVIVTATIPVRMNGDTLEINPAAFKMRPDAVVEELLNEVPGVTIWADGTITVNGRKVQNFYVDGKPFLGVSDPRFATQNLPKTAIEKIQVYQEFDRSKIGQETQSQPQDSVLNMNVKLKESSKKGYFGKAGAGYGTADRFESDLSFQVYNKRSSLGIGGGLNNINKDIGNLQALFRNNTYRNFNPNLYNVGRFGSPGISRNHSIGGLLTHNFIETQNSRQQNQVSLSYNKSGTDNYLTDLVLQNRTTAATPQVIREEGVQNNQNDRHDINFNYGKTTGYNDDFRVAGNTHFNSEMGNSSRSVEVRDANGTLESTNTTRSIHNNRSENGGLDVSYGKSDGYNPLKNFNLQMNVNHGNSFSERDAMSSFNSFTNNSTDTSFVRRYTTDNQSFNVGGNLRYSGLKRLLFRRFDLFGIDLQLGQRFNYRRSSTNTNVSDYDSTSKLYTINTALSNFNKSELIEYTPSIRANKSFNKWSNSFYRVISLNASVLDDFKVDRNSSSIAKRNLGRSFQFLRYEGSLNYQYQNHQKFMYYSNLTFSRNFQYPSVDRLYTIVDDINAYDIRIGNPELENTIQNNLNVNMNFNTMKPKSLYSFNGNVNGRYTRSVNPVTDSVINEPSGRRIHYYTNADQSSNLHAGYNLNVSRRIAKSSIQFGWHGSANATKVPSYVDNIYTISQNNNLYNHFGLHFNLRSLLVFNIARSYQQSRTKQTAASLTPFSNKNVSSRVGFTLNYPASFTFSSTLDHIRNTNIEKPTVLWNSFASYRFLKQQGELKLTAMDLLKQYQNISNSAGPFGTTTRVTNGLQQYFLLTFSYYPRKFGKTELKRQ